MALPMNDDFANRELSIEELEAVAAGGLFGDILNFVAKETRSIGNFIGHHPWVAGNVTNQVVWVGKHIF